MIIRKYGIELHRITRCDLELIREARNREHIRRRMFEQAQISPTQQLQWFDSIDNQHHYYFLIHHQGRPVGLINGKDVDYDKREAEGGIFVWEPDLIGTPVPALASICFMEASFALLRLQRIRARVREDNAEARRYNLALGYQPDASRGREYLILTREIFERRIPFLRGLAGGSRPVAPLSIADVEIPQALSQRHLYESLPTDILDVFRPRLLRPAGWL